MNKTEAGKVGERKAIAYLKDKGFSIENTGNEKANSPYDVLAKKDNILYAINVKTVSGEKGLFGIQLSNISRLLGFCKVKNAVPSYVLIHNYKFTFFSFKEDFSDWEHPVFTDDAEDGYEKLTANIPSADIAFVDKLVSKGKFASRTDAAREAFRCLRRDVEGTKKNDLKQAPQPPADIVVEPSLSSATGGEQV